jgi:hypothetical protein
MEAAMSVRSVNVSNFSAHRRFFDLVAGVRLAIVFLMERVMAHLGMEKGFVDGL